MTCPPLPLLSHERRLGGECCDSLSRQMCGIYSLRREGTPRQEEARGSPGKRRRCARYSLPAGIWLTSSSHLIRAGTNTGARQMSAGVGEANLFSSICLSTSHDTGIKFFPPLPPPLGERQASRVFPVLPQCFPGTTLRDERVCATEQDRSAYIYFPRSLMFPVRSRS